MTTSLAVKSRTNDTKKDIQDGDGEDSKEITTMGAILNCRPPKSEQKTQSGSAEQEIVFNPDKRRGIQTTQDFVFRPSEQADYASSAPMASKKQPANKTEELQNHILDRMQAHLPPPPVPSPPVGSFKRDPCRLERRTKTILHVKDKQSEKNRTATATQLQSRILDQLQGFRSDGSNEPAVVTNNIMEFAEDDDDTDEDDESVTYS